MVPATDATDRPPGIVDLVMTIPLAAEALQGLGSIGVQVKGTPVAEGDRRQQRTSKTHEDMTGDLEVGGITADRVFHLKVTEEY